MLTESEIEEVQKFTAEMDDETATAMLNLFTLTKPGCDDAANELMMAAHKDDMKVSAPTISAYSSYDLVTSEGVTPEPIKQAIRKAVSQGYLVMRGPEDQASGT